MKYTPLDLSFIHSHTSPEANSIRNTAAMIMANASWNQPSQVTLKEISAAKKKAQAEYNSAHKQTFLSSFFDLLSTPLYGVANALDESIAGHQSDPNDSVLEDIAKTAGGIGTGLVRGVGAGLRGATGILDALPGVDINDEWQSNPEDKTHFSDVAIRKETGMATGDAMKPENWDKIKPLLEKINEKPWYNKTLFQAAVPDDLEDPKAREKFFRNEALAGIPSDIGGDPLNLMFLGGKSAATAAKGITEGLDTARASGDSAKNILDALKIKNGSNFANKSSLDIGNAPVQAIDETVKGGTKVNLAATPFDLPKGNFKDLGNLGRRESVQPKGSSLTPRAQKDVATQIGKWAAIGDKSWVYRAGQYLHNVDSSVEWNKTFEFLDKANKAVKQAGIKHNPERMVPVLLQRMQEDISAAGHGTGEIERRLLNTKTDVVIRPGAPKLKRSEAILANKTVRKFEGEILGKRSAPGTGPQLARAIAEGRNVRYSGPQQARMWNQITSSLKFADARKFDKAVRILRATEDYFIGKGVIPHSAAKTAESVPLRLSQVAEAIGPQFLGKSHAFITGILRGDSKALAQLSSSQIEAINALKASEAVATAPAVQRGLNAARDVAETVSKAPMSVARKNQNMSTLIKNMKTFTAAEGGGDAGAHVVGEYMGNLLGKKDVINAALSANRLKTEAWLAKAGRGAGSRHFLANDADFAKSVTRAISEAADLPNPAKLGLIAGSGARVVDWLGARFNAAYGVQDMSPILWREQASAMSTTARRANLLNKLGRRFPPSETDLWHEAFRTAQTNGIADGRVAELHAEISKVMENLFGGTGLRSGAIADSTVIGRNRLLVDELNKNLKRFGLGQFSFAAKKVKDAAGVEHDFSKGMDWMKSWEAWDVKNPYEFLHKVQNAIEFTVREKNMFDEIVARFASPAKNGQVKFGVNHPRLNGYFFTAEGAKQAKQFVHVLEEISTPNSKALQHFDHVLSKIKAGLTIYMPGHHWTNLIGSVYFDWLAGVNKPIRYEQAMKTMLAQKGRYGDFANFDKLTGPKALEQAVARSMVKPNAGLNIPAAGNKTIVTMQNGTKVTADMLYTAAFREGVLPSAKVLEDVGTEVTSVLDKIKPLGGRGQRTVHQIAEVREHIPRMALFIDRVAKSKGSFEVAVRDASSAVRKWHPDGLGFTSFERKFMKRVFPFYSWTRKAIPLAIESAIFSGPKVMAYPRLMEAIALANGVDPAQATTDPFPTDQLFPDWLRNRGIGPIAGGPGNYTVINPSTPVLDVLAQMGNPGQTSIDMLNPLIKVPIETAQSNTLGDASMPLDTNQQWLDYAVKQVPILSTAGRVSGQVGVSDSTRAEGFPNWTNLINLLTGAKKVDTGKYQKSAQFDLRDYLRQKAQQQGR